jgi:ATP-dependent DNA helicase RecQ
VCSLDPLAAARECLARHFGYPEFRAPQARVIEAVLAGKDVLAVLPTGGGKSICFQVPALLSPGVTLVISPLISLMQDQVSAACARGLPAGAMNSSLSAREQRALLDQAAAGRLKLLYTSPERLRRLSRELEERGVRPSRLAVDEAHCISEWGHDFRPAYRALRRYRAALGWPPAVALTGSATPDVRRDIARCVGLGTGRSLVSVVGSFDRPNLWFGVVPVRSEAARMSALLALLRREAALSIVYAPTRGLVEELARVLLESGFRARAYHAGLDTASRKEVLGGFLRDDIGVVVATCAFGMGIDKPNVRLVVHWTLPATPESYYQEAGRAGRDGDFARCVLLYRPGDAAMPLRQLEVTFPDEALAERVWSGKTSPDRLPRNVRDALDRLRGELRPDLGRVDWRPVRRRREAARARVAVVDHYAADRRCRRAALLAYFGESKARCTGCDVCGRNGPAPVRDRDAERRLARLRVALSHTRALWGGCVLDPEALRRVAVEVPAGAAELAAIPGVGPIVAARYSRTILAALGRLEAPAAEPAPPCGSPAGRDRGADPGR